MTLVKNNGGRITITNVISTTTGDVVLNGGSIVIAETAGFSACQLVRVGGGTLELRNSAALPDTTAVRVQEGAKVAIKEGVTVTVDKLFLDGEQQIAGTWGAVGSGADHVNDTFFSGLGTLNVISGTQVVYADAVWDGGGTGAGDGFSVAANWDGDALPSFDGFSRAIFATGGSTATVDTPATFTKMTFNAASDFTVAAGAGTLTVGGGGIKAGASTPSPSDRTYTIASDLILDDHQFWNITKNGTGTTYLHVSGAISDGGNAFNLTQRGDSVLILSGNNSYGGVTTIATNYAVVRHPNALGSAAGNTIVQDGAYLVVEGGFTLNEPITINGDDVIRWSGTLRSNAGTNTLAAKLTSSYARIRTNNNGCWEVVGGVDGGRLICSAVYGTYIRFAEKPITAGGLTCHTHGGTVIIAVAGNTFTSMEAGGNELRVDVPNAWPANLFLRQGSQGSAGSILNFNGNDQSVGTLIGNYAGSGVRVTYSVAPMTLTVDQSDNTIYNAMITGAVSVVKLGTGKLTLTNAYHTTSGSFTVSNGTLSVSNFGSLGPNSTNIVVGGSGTLDLSSTNPSMIADTAVVTMPESGVSTAKINLAAGVNESVGWLFYGDKMKRAGTYGASGSAATYKDNTHFSGTGVLKVLHDNAGTLMWLR